MNFLLQITLAHILGYGAVIWWIYSNEMPLMYTSTKNKSASTAFNRTAITYATTAIICTGTSINGRSTSTAFNRTAITSGNTRTTSGNTSTICRNTRTAFNRTAINYRSAQNLIF